MGEAEEAIGVGTEEEEVEVVDLECLPPAASGVAASDLQVLVITAAGAAGTEVEDHGLIRKKVRMIAPPLPQSLTCLTPRRNCQSSDRTLTIRTTSHSDVAISRWNAFSEALEVALVCMFATLEVGQGRQGSSLLFAMTVFILQQGNGIP